MKSEDLLFYSRSSVIQKVRFFFTPWLQGHHYCTDPNEPSDSLKQLFHRFGDPDYGQNVNTVICFRFHFLRVDAHNGAFTKSWVAQKVREFVFSSVSVPSHKKRP